MDRMKMPFFSASFIRSLSARKAPPPWVLVGSIATIPTFFPCAERAAATLPVIVLFPAPGGPVMPTTWAPVVHGKSAESSRYPSSLPSSMREMSLAALFSSPSNIFPASPLSVKTTLPSLDRLLSLESLDLPLGVAKDVAVYLPVMLTEARGEGHPLAVLLEKRRHVG